MCRLIDQILDREYGPIRLLENLMFSGISGGFRYFELRCSSSQRGHDLDGFLHLIIDTHSEGFGRNLNHDVRMHSSPFN